MIILEAIVKRRVKNEMHEKQPWKLESNTYNRFGTVRAVDGSWRNKEARG